MDGHRAHRAYRTPPTGRLTVIWPLTSGFGHRRHLWDALGTRQVRGRSLTESCAAGTEGRKRLMRDLSSARLPHRDRSEARPSLPAECVRCGGHGVSRNENGHCFRCNRDQEDTTPSAAARSGPSPLAGDGMPVDDIPPRAPRRSPIGIIGNTMSQKTPCLPPDVVPGARSMP